MTVLNWVPSGAGWKAEMPGNVTLFASPDRTKRIMGDKPARGTKWRAGASHWNEATRTMSRFGRDVYAITFSDYREARKIAETIYFEAIAKATGEK